MCVCYRLSCHCLTATVGTVSRVLLPRCSGLSSTIDFTLSMAVGSVVHGRPRQPATSAGVKYWCMASCAGASCGIRRREGEREGERERERERE